MRIIVDVDGYKGRKERRARELARVSAERVKRLGKRVTLTGLDAHERRIVHLYFREDPEIITLSEGEGAEKKVIIQKREKT
jgi:spoIIIJ-associated protein